MPSAFSATLVAPSAQHGDGRIDTTNRRRHPPTISLMRWTRFRNAFGLSPLYSAITGGDILSMPYSGFHSTVSFSFSGIIPGTGGKPGRRAVDGGQPWVRMIALDGRFERRCDPDGSAGFPGNDTYNGFAGRILVRPYGCRQGFALFSFLKTAAVTSPDFQMTGWSLERWNRITDTGHHASRRAAI